MKIFSKKKYIEIQGNEVYLDNKGWVDKCDGKTLSTEMENGDGLIGNYFIAFEFMEEKNE